MGQQNKGGPGGANPQNGSAQAPGTSTNPADEAPLGTPGAGENVCRRCEGKGRLEGGAECPDCGGTGVVIEEIGGA